MLRAMDRWLLFLLCLVCFGCQSDPPLSVATVELQRMEGKWFEIARLPRLSQQACVGTTAEYRLVSATELVVVNECREGNLEGPLRRAHARALVNDEAEPAKLSLDFGFAYGDYWILEVADDYRYAVVGHPSRDYLWILSRRPTLSPPDLAGVLQRARSRGFPTAILEYTEQ